MIDDEGFGSLSSLEIGMNMCGIAGIVGPNWSQEQLEAMVAVQRHRGPDDSGVYLDQENRVGLGHNRLSIIDLSAAGHQPMSNGDGTLWIVFNDEIGTVHDLVDTFLRRTKIHHQLFEQICPILADFRPTRH